MNAAPTANMVARQSTSLDRSAVARTMCTRAVMIGVPGTNQENRKRNRRHMETDKMEIEFKLKLVNTQLHNVISAQGLTPVDAEDYGRTLAFLGFSARIVHALRGKGIITLGDLMGMRRSSLSRIRNIGARSVAEIDRYMERHHLYMAN